MVRHLTLAFVALVLVSGISQLAAQSPSAQDFTFQVSPAQPWTDTGLDLQAGDVVDISAEPAPSAEKQAAPGAPACDPKGISNSSIHATDLPLPAVPAGSLIARLQQGATPMPIGASKQVKIEEASHLFVGMNAAGAPLCQGGLTVKVHKAITGDANSQQQSRGEQLKSQLGTAAQIFMQGQFGMGSGGTNGSEAPAAPKVSNAALDPELRKDVDGLPRRVNDQFKNQGDMVNFVIVGSQKDLEAALTAASWHVADTNNERAALSAVMETYENKDYLAMPMSILYLFGRKQDFGYEMAEPIAMVASRHHFRIWKAPFTWKGQEVWVGAGTHDIGFAKDKRNNNVTHKIDPAVDGERDNIGSSLQKTNKTKSMSYYLPPNPVQDAKNATGDGYHSDGRLLIVFLQ